MAKCVDDKRQSESDPPFWEVADGGSRVHDVHAKKTHAARATRGVGMGGARVAISRPEAMAVTTQTVNPCGPAHL